MADEKLTAGDEDDLAIVEVAELPSGAPPASKPEPDDEEDDKPLADADEDEDDDEDARLADDADADTDEDDPKRRKRVKRRQIQKLAKERTLQELQFLRRQNEDLARRVQAVEGASIGTSVAQIDQKLAEVQRDIRQADLILAKAIEAGNGTDAAEALRLRDEAKAVEQDLARNKAAITSRRDNPPPAQVDPRVTSYADQWKQANPWYDSRGGDEDSAVVNLIDNRLAAEGYDPTSQDYWSELTRRVKTRLSSADDKPAAREKRKAPPQGVAREHAPQSTRREVYVTPERKQAMVDAGVWEDPAKRAQMLKAYEKYDRENRSAG